MAFDAIGTLARHHARERRGLLAARHAAAARASRANGARSPSCSRLTGAGFFRSGRGSRREDVAPRRERRRRVVVLPSQPSSAHSSFDGRSTLRGGCWPWLAARDDSPWCVSTDGSAQRLRRFPDRRARRKPSVRRRWSSAGCRAAKRASRGEGGSRLGPGDRAPLRTSVRCQERAMGRAGGIADVHFAGRDRLLAAVQGTGLVSFDLKSGASQRRGRPPDRPVRGVSRDGRFAVGTATVDGSRGSGVRCSAFDLEDGSAQALPSHGTDVTAIALDASGLLVATGSCDGTIRVGRVSGEEPHLLLGQQGSIHSIAFSPDGRWLATAGEAFAIHLWPVPDVSKPPLHRRPHDELLTVLRQPHQPAGRTRRRFGDGLQARARPIPRLGEGAGMVKSRLLLAVVAFDAPARDAGFGAGAARIDRGDRPGHAGRRGTRSRRHWRSSASGLTLRDRHRRLRHLSFRLAAAGPLRADRPRSPVSSPLASSTSTWRSAFS